MTWEEEIAPELVRALKHLHRRRLDAIRKARRDPEKVRADARRHMRRRRADPAFAAREGKLRRMRYALSKHPFQDAACTS